MRKSSDAAAQTLFVFSSQKPRKRYFLYCTFHKSFKGHPTVTLGSAIPEEKIGHFRAFLWPSAPVGAPKSCTLIAAPLCDVANFRLFKNPDVPNLFFSTNPKNIWSRPGSNRGPSACKADVMTTTLQDLLDYKITVKIINFKL